MAGAFDAYHKWLGIPPEDQPPDHYRLLGIKRFEPDPDVISNAADQRMVHVRAFQTGEHAELSQQVLNELSAARVCLLNPERKLEYDQQLREQMQRKVEAPRPITARQVKAEERRAAKLTPPKEGGEERPGAAYSAGWGKPMIIYRCDACRTSMTARPDQTGNRQICPMCGAKAVVPEQSDPDATPIDPNTTTLCPHCGEEIKVIAKKCKHCGEWLDKEAAPTPVQTGELTAKMWKEHQLAAGGAILVGCVLLVLAAILWSGALAVFALIIFFGGCIYMGVVNMFVWWYHG
jgi:predicted RNA-binding Zn-ribbon protein involved in translation (DUF1610 family)